MSTHKANKRAIKIPSLVVISGSVQGPLRAKLKQAINGLVQFMIQYPALQLTTYALAFKALILNLTNSESLAILGMDYFNQCNGLHSFKPS